MPSRFERAAEPSFAFKERFRRRDPLLERIDLVDQLRFRLAKALLPDCGWIGHVPLLANRLYLGGFLEEEDVTTRWPNEPIRAGSAGNHPRR